MIHTIALNDFVAQGWEHLRLVAYLDSESVPTIGYGHTRDVKLGDTCTVEQAKAWLNEELAQSAREVTGLVRVPLKQHQFDALVSFVYNLGAGAFARSSLRKRVNGSENDKAACELLRWHMGSGKRRRGLMARRCCEALMYGRGEYVTPDD